MCVFVCVCVCLCVSVCVFHSLKTAFNYFQKGGTIPSHMSLVGENWSSGFQTRSDTVQAVQPTQDG